LSKSEKQNSKVIYPTGVCKALKRIGAFWQSCQGVRVILAEVVRRLAVENPIRPQNPIA
jgi:hypothetical protein